MGNLSKNFSKSEFACSCGCGFDVPDLHLVTILQKIRDDLGTSMRITSGCRCKEYNRKIGSKDTSQHVKGKAVDISCYDSHARYRLITTALKHGITRIGVRKDFLHLDIGDEDAPQQVIWMY